MIDYASILRAAGLTVIEVAGWRERSHPGSFTAQGGVWHHTAGVNDVAVVVNGRRDLAGPLANLYHGRDGSWTVVSGGVAWHAGPGSRRVFEDLRAGVAPQGDALALDLVDDFPNANHFLIGVESEGGVGVGDWPQVQIESLVAGTAALCRELGLGADQWVHHREWTRRKEDMSYRGDLRGRVAALLGSGHAGPSAVVGGVPASVPSDLPEPQPTPPTPAPNPEEVMYVVIEAPHRSPAFFTTDGVGHPMGRGGWTFINRFASKHPTLVVFDSSWTAAEYDMVCRLPAHSADEILPPDAIPPGLAPDPGNLGIGDPAPAPPDGGPTGTPTDTPTLPPDLLTLPDDVPDPRVGAFA
ncbi:MAG: hypothetical protein QOF39_1787 [Frankiales bacterium]|nr:hypothetical protein [Frankiales bacterium]